MRQLFLLVALLFVLPLSAIAQEKDLSSPLALNEQMQAMFRVVGAPLIRTVLEGEDRNGMIFLMLAEPPVSIYPGFKEEFGITPEQMQQFRTTMNEAMGKAPPPMLQELEKKVREDVNYVPTDEETAEVESFYRFAIEQTNAAYANTFTEEQTSRINNAVFGITGRLQSPFLSEQHMDALEMTNEQKAQFKKINEETKPEREKLIAAFEAEIQKTIKTGKISVNDFFRAFSKFRQLGSTLKKRRSEVLTPAQIAKAREMAKLPKSMTWSPFDMLPQWGPGPNSWKPGDPIPGGVAPRPPGNFPRRENPNP